MGLNHGGKIVTDGLVLMLDASNIKSYRGDPTTNMVSYSEAQNLADGYTESLSGWDTHDGSLLIDAYNKVDNITNRSIKMICNQANVYKYHISSLTLTNGQTYTASFWAKSTVAGSLSNFFLGDGPGGYLVIEPGGYSSITTNWKRFEYTFTLSSATGSYNFATYLYGDGQIIWITGIQIENLNHATHYIASNGSPSTRGTTVATGGGWKDLSGNGNHGVVNNGEYIDGYLRNLGNVSNFFSISIDNSTSINDTFTQITGGWTIEEIIWTNSLTYPECDAGSVVSNDGYGSGKGFDWNHGYGSGDFKFEQIGGASNDTPAFSVPSPYNSLNVWRNRTMVWNRSSNTNSLYINGNFINSGSTPNTSGQIIYDGGGISLGTLYGWKHHGRRAGLKIYNRVLTLSEIYQNFNTTKGRYGLT